MEQSNSSDDLSWREKVIMASFFLGVGFWISTLFFFSKINIQTILFCTGLIFLAIAILLTRKVRKEVEDGKQGY